MYQQLPSWFDNDDSNDDQEEEDRAITTMDDVDNDNHNQQFLNSIILAEINTPAGHQARTSLLIVSMYQHVRSWFGNGGGNSDHYEEEDNNYDGRRRQW